MSIRKVSSHYLRLPDGTYLHQQVVELCDGKVVTHYDLDGEQENIEWLPGGVIELVQNTESVTIAFFLSPFNFIDMKPVDGTRRIQLK